MDSSRRREYPQGALDSFTILGSLKQFDIPSVELFHKSLRSLTSRLSLDQNWESLISRGPLDHNQSRAVIVAAFRMRTSHDYLAVHLRRSNVLPSPECQLCDFGTMNAEHLRTCSAVDHSKNIKAAFSRRPISTGQCIT
ncbi:hypothetical protein TNCT_147641 [Trichonephila clavata]|uniref:Reverse transcriptase n=1 Tax=Trichonephila clavata TaxID=2740835 RepID=A0A8X6FGQ2_TRICU|nr:hypothetical protein TNCT_147641 [Trichonephila clavata]